MRTRPHKRPNTEEAVDNDFNKKQRTDREFPKDLEINNPPISNIRLRDPQEIIKQYINDNQKYRKDFEKIR